VRERRRAARGELGIEARLLVRVLDDFSVVQVVRQLWSEGYLPAKSWTDVRLAIS